MPPAPDGSEAGTTLAAQIRAAQGMSRGGRRGDAPHGGLACFTCPAYYTRSFKCMSMPCGNHGRVAPLRISATCTPMTSPRGFSRPGPAVGLRRCSASEAFALGGTHPFRPPERPAPSGHSRQPSAASGPSRADLLAIRTSPMLLWSHIVELSLPACASQWETMSARERRELCSRQARPFSAQPRCVCARQSSGTEAAGASAIGDVFHPLEPVVRVRGLDTLEENMTRRPWRKHDKAQCCKALQSRDTGRTRTKPAPQST